MKKTFSLCSLYLATSIYSVSFAHDLEKTETIEVQGHKTNILGQTISASEGVISDAEINIKPLLRTGELLEFVPGMVVTQHSGSGKANQYFLRGFNLDHGTDFSTYIDGMPINMRTHGHGQGYTDLNFIIPEFINNIHYKKGTYYATLGDFSSAGSAEFTLKNNFDKPTLSATMGENNFQRLFAGTQIDFANGHLLSGVELEKYDGPWTDINEDIEKFNGLLRYYGKTLGGDLSVNLMHYSNRWNSADQIPLRAVQQKLIDRLGSLDKAAGGKSDRTSLSGNWTNGDWDVSAYWINSSLNLFSNFTYYLEQPDLGDQFEQVDKRDLFGGKINNTQSYRVGNIPVIQTVGLEYRFDDIGEVALYQSHERQRYSAIKKDKVKESSLGTFYQLRATLTDKLNATLGLRYDYFTVDVNSNLTANSGDANEGLFTSKFSLAYLVNENVESYLSVGQGFHSNDARGATISIDPLSGDQLDPVDLLVKSDGAEIGVRWFKESQFNISTALWYLELDSELLFVGDAGNTEASRPSRRYGAELSTYYWVDSNWSIDTELAWSRSRFRDTVEDEGQFIDGALPFVASAGISYSPKELGFKGSIRYRYFAARALDSTNTIKANSTQSVNVNIGYRWDNITIEVDGLNLFESKDNDIEYYYASRLNGEPATGVEDLHFHPLTPRTFRASLTYQF